jgi:hypothetical protein
LQCINEVPVYKNKLGTFKSGMEPLQRRRATDKIVLESQLDDVKFDFIGRKYPKERKVYVLGDYTFRWADEFVLDESSLAEPNFNDGKFELTFSANLLYPIFEEFIQDKNVNYWSIDSERIHILEFNRKSWDTYTHSFKNQLMQRVRYTLEGFFLLMRVFDRNNSFVIESISNNFDVVVRNLRTNDSVVIHMGRDTMFPSFRWNSRVPSLKRYAWKRTNRPDIPEPLECQVCKEPARFVCEGTDQVFCSEKCQRLFFI